MTHPDRHNDHCAHEVARTPDATTSARNRLIVRSRVEFEVYVTGADGRSATAVRNLTTLCESGFDGEYLIRVIDVLDDPDAAERQRIMATPMIVRRHPLPDRRVIGDLEDLAGLAEHLGLRNVDQTTNATSLPPGDPTC